MNERFLTVTEVAQLLHISRSHAYKVIHRLNQELKAKGVLTIAGRISRSSLGSDDAINERIRDYGMVIMDECHHAGAANAEAVLREVSARYVYGLTATPKRDDGMEQKIFMQFGPIRWRFTSKERIAMQGFTCIVRPRFTALINVSEPWKIQEAYQAVIHDVRSPGLNRERTQWLLDLLPFLYQRNVAYSCL